MSTSGRRHAKPVEQRFWQYVQRGADDECWPWTGANVNGGYGVIRDTAPSSKMVKATHVSLRIAGRPLADGQNALHECDNPPCVNPKHLFAGTLGDNHQDKMRKGRHRSVRTRGGSNLTAGQAREIRRRALAGDGHQHLADEFGISTCHVSFIRNNKTWKDA